MISITLLGAFFVSGAVCAQAQAPQFPCEEDERFSQFDFWVGEWDVHVANDTYAGSNVIASSYRSCVLVESWTSASGNTGMSINYVDDQTGEWVQVWNDSNGSQINIRGGLTDDGMHAQSQRLQSSNCFNSQFETGVDPMHCCQTDGLSIQK